VEASVRLLVTMKVVMVILLLMHVTRHKAISASLGDVIVAGQHRHQLQAANLPPVAAPKRWAPTEIRMNEFIHKIRSRFHGQPPSGFVRRAVRQITTTSGRAAADTGRKMLRNNRRADKQNRAASGVKLYRLRTRFGRIPNAMNAGET